MENYSLNGSDIVQSREMPMWGWWISQIVTPMIAFVGIVGNCLSFLVMKSKRLRKKSYSHMLCALAIFDSLSLISRETALANELNMYRGGVNIFVNFSNVGCKMYGYFEHMCYLMSSWLIVSMAIERVQAVCLPFRKTVLRRQMGAVIVVFVLFVVLTISQAFRFVMVGNVHGFCSATDQYIDLYTALYIYFYQMTLIFVLPFVIVLACNSMVIYQIFRVKNEAGNNRPSSLARTQKTTFMLLTISFMYIVTMFPLFVISVTMHQVANPFSEDGRIMYFKLKPISDLLSTVSYMNYAINFFIYVLCGKSFRVELKRVFIRRHRNSMNGTRTRTKEEVIRLQ